jgi:hypothetical protein
VPLCYTFADDWVAWLRRRVAKKHRRAVVASGGEAANAAAV